jgi:putative membrane protein
MKIIIRLAVYAVALFAAVLLLQGNGLNMRDPSVTNYLLLALIFAVINTFLKPILKIVGCPILVLTLGLGSLLINALLFWILSLIAKQLHIGFEVTTFWGAFLGALIVSVVSVILNRILRD